MATAKKRILFYLLLAIVCYLIAAYLGAAGIAAAVFVAGGLVAELIFWRHLYLRLRGRPRP